MSPDFFDNEDPAVRPGQTPGGKALNKNVFGEDFKPWESIDPSYSQEQWKAWEANRDPSCPPDKPYKTERTNEDGTPITQCVEKPVDCPPGSYAHDAGGRMTCKQGNAPGGGGGGGGKGGGGGAGGGGAVGAAFGGPGFFDPAAGIAGATGAGIAGILAGGTRFSPEVMARIQAQGKGIQQSRIASETQGLQENLAARGLNQSPLGASLEQTVRQGAADSYDQFVGNVETQKALTDFEDKLKGIGLGLEWAKDLRNYYLGLDSNAVQREGIGASLELGYARIQSEMQQLMATLGSRKELLGLEIDSNEWQTTQKLILCLNLGQC